MSEVEILIEGEFKKTKYKELNSQLAPLIRSVFKEVVNAIEEKSIEFASGVKLAPQKLPGQADHKIGKSESGYVSTGTLADNIEVIRSPVRGYSFFATIKSNSDYASYVEFGTGIYGPTGTVIKSKDGGSLNFHSPKYGAMGLTEIQGQRPNPVLRGSVWWAQDHIGEIAKKAQSSLKGSQIRSTLDVSMEIQ
jgi:hypothetical protein